jgi:hypothetical protein
MRTVRAMIVVLTALSLALLPVAGVAAPVTSADSISAHADCCPPGGDCAKHSKSDSKGGCTEDGACAAKCAGVSAIPLASAEAASLPNASAELTPIPRLRLPVAPNPPSPPPRA